MIHHEIKCPLFGRNTDGAVGDKCHHCGAVAQMPEKDEFDEQIDAICKACSSGGYECGYCREGHNLMNRLLKAAYERGARDSFNAHGTAASGL